MSLDKFIRRALFGTSLLAAAAAAQQSPAPAQAGIQAGTQANVLAQDFKAALADYDAGHFAEAASTLEKLQVLAQSSYDVHELLGMTYGAQGNTAAALQQLQQAALLKPDSATARTNLAAALTRAGEFAQAEAQCREALASHPADYSANRILAQLYLRKDDPAKALPFLQAAQAARPTAADNGYDLSLTLLMQKRFDDAASLIHSLQAQHDSGELHNLLGQINEQKGQYLDAAGEFAAAAHMDPTEDNLFVWASELLLHRAYEAAITVFKSATQRYPASPRLWTGLGMSFYSRGEYADAISSLLKAADLRPDDPRCYLFLSRAYLSSPSQAEEVIARFRKYAALKPDDALAQYYYAIGLWKGRRLETPDVDYPAVETLLKKSIALDGNLAETHLQLGILYNDQQKFASAGPEYQRALQLDPTLADAHFRLGRYFLHTGDKEKAAAEFQTFKTLQAQHQAQVDKDRASVQQFVVNQPQPASAQP